MITAVPRSADLLRGGRFRLIAAREALLSYRFGATLDELAHDIAEVTGERCHPRTVRRDLNLLEALGVAVISEGPAKGNAETRFAAVRSQPPSAPTVPTVDVTTLTARLALAEQAAMEAAKLTGQCVILTARLAAAEQAAVNARLRLGRALRLVQRLRQRQRQQRQAAPLERGAALMQRGVAPAVIEAAPAVASLAARTLAAKLSPRKQAILERLAAGRSSAEIAAEFGCAVTSIDTHRSRIRKQLGLRSPDALMRFALLAFGSRTDGTSLFGESPP